jgi:hypothetical protein
MKRQLETGLVGLQKDVKSESATPTHVELKFPPTEEWNNIVRDCKLTGAQANELEITLKDALDDIDRYYSKLQNRPSRDLLVDRLKKFDKALRHLQDECRRSAHLMQDFWPADTLAYVGQSLTFSAMSAALGRSVFPEIVDFKIRGMRTKGERITLASIEHLSRSKREALGLKHGHLILTHFIERIHAPFPSYIELARKNKGGRPADAARRHFIYRLAEAAPDIIGKPATIATTGKFVDLCTSVLPACGLPEKGIEKAIPAVVRKLRADRGKRRIGVRKLRADRAKRRIGQTS